MNLNMSNVKETLAQGKKILKNNNIDQFSLDADLFMMESVGFSKTELFTKDDYNLTQDEFNRFKTMIEKRLDGVPTQYILGRCEFMGIDFFVNENVLIPRCDTEILVELVLDWAKKNGAAKFLDMCTGSGCIAISTAFYGKINGDAVDISKEALEIANKNAMKNGVADMVNFINSDLFEKINSDKVYDFIVSNPPYIETHEIERLMVEVKNNEPYIALDGGVTGVDFYEIIAEKAYQHLKVGGGLFFEIGYNQGQLVSNILQKNNYSNIIVTKDLAGLDRVVWGIKTQE